MIKAKFDKGTPTAEGITYTLKRKCNPSEKKHLVRESAEFYDEDCTIDVTTQETEKEEDPGLSQYINEMWTIMERVRKQGQAEGAKMVNDIIEDKDTRAVNVQKQAEALTDYSESGRDGLD